MFVVLITVLSLTICCGNQKEPSPRSSLENPARDISIASTFEELFDIVSLVQLDTLPECPIGSITDLDIDGQGNFIIADGWRVGQVYSFAPNGHFRGRVGRHGQGPGEYATPVSVAVNPSGKIVVCDYLQNQLVFYDQDYRYQRSIRGNPRFQYFIHINGIGEIYTYSGTVGPRNIGVFNTIHKFDDSGKEVLSFGPIQAEVLDTGFSAVIDGMSIDSDGFIYEKNPLFSQVRKFGPGGVLIRSFARPDIGEGIEDFRSGHNSSGPFYLREGLLIVQRGKTIDLFDKDGNFIRGDIPLRHKILMAKEDTLYLESQSPDSNQDDQANPIILQAVLRRSRRPRT